MVINLLSSILVDPLQFAFVPDFVRMVLPAEQATLGSDKTAVFGRLLGAVVAAKPGKEAELLGVRIAQRDLFELVVVQLLDHLGGSRSARRSLVKAGPCWPRIQAHSRPHIYAHPAAS